MRARCACAASMIVRRSLCNRFVFTTHQRCPARLTAAGAPARPTLSSPLTCTPHAPRLPHPAAAPTRRFINSNSSSTSPSSSPPTSALPLFDYSSSLTPLRRSSPPLPARVRIVEVGPRDGLQNERVAVSAADKVRLVDGLSECGLSVIEVGSFVSPRWVPAMADSLDVFRNIRRHSGVSYAALTPNVTGLDRAIEAGASEVAVFASASESFSRANINCSIDDSLRRFTPLLEKAKQKGIRVRGYVSCVIGWFEQAGARAAQGYIDPSAVVRVTQWLLNAGCYEVSLGDTIGIGTPGRVSDMLMQLLSAGVPATSLAVHFHDTYGQALANILQSVQLGVAVVDSSISGLGGCPYAAGATGNVATEDVVFMLHGAGVDTGVDLRKLLKLSKWVSGTLGRATQSKVTAALRSHIG